MGVEVTVDDYDVEEFGCSIETDFVHGAFPGYDSQ